MIRLFPELILDNYPFLHQLIAFVPISQWAW
jgi:hypothetical protein